MIVKNIKIEQTYTLEEIHQKNNTPYRNKNNNKSHFIFYTIDRLPETSVLRVYTL